MSEITYTDGSKYVFIDICDCGLTGGCEKCNPFYPFWEGNIKIVEERKKEYYPFLEK